MSKLTQTQKDIKKVCKKLQKMLLKKNRAYGNSATEPVRVFSTSPADEQLRVRMDDKLSRISRGKKFKEEDPAWDLCGYLVLDRVLKLQKKRANPKVKAR